MSHETMDPDDPLIGKEIGHCKIQRKLGQGGMGAVYLAHHPGLNRAVAIKILPGDLASDPEYRERFFREARLAARLEHPNVVQVHDVGEEEGVHYISMQYIEGKSLDLILKEKKKLSASEALSITKRVAVALSAAAKLGIVHRDIKPHNILLSKDGVVKVADFGLAKDEDSNRSLSEPGAVMGTPYYMSPEQAKGEKVDHRSDLYSLGATLYHMLTGRRLFDGGSPVSIVMKQASERPVPARQVEPSIPEPVAALLDRVLEKDPAKRFASADELVRALDALKGPGASALPAAPPAAPPKRKAAVVALPLAGLLLVGIVLGLMLGRNKPSVPVVMEAPAKPAQEKAVAPTKSPEETPAKADPAPKSAPLTPANPRERLLSLVKDALERKYTEEVMARTEEFLQAASKKDLRSMRSMLDEIAFGQVSDEQLQEILVKTHADKGALESWEFQDVDIRMKVPGARPQPHATATMIYIVTFPKGSLKIQDQLIHWIRRLDGRWYVTKPPRLAK
jgi:serine/threonine protein kinase